MNQNNISKNGVPYDDVKLGRPIKLLGATALIVGAVIGMGVYVFIGSIGAHTGSAMWIAFTIALIITILGIAPLIQMSSAMPRAGVAYVYASRLLNPLMGITTSSWAILGVACTSTYVSMGIAEYAAPYLPWDIPVLAIALAIPIIFFIIYFFGLKLATGLQVIMVALLVFALMGYGIIGSLKYGMSFSLTLPLGVGGLIMASVLAFTAFFGFQVITEMGEEIVNAKKNIPLSIIIGGLIILMIYIIVGAAFIGSVPYDFETIKAMKAPLKETGEIFLPPFWVAFLSLGALFAGLTSINAAAIGIPRELYAQSRDGLLPPFISRVHRRTRTPLNAVGTYFILVIILLLLQLHIDIYGVATAVGVLILTTVSSIAAWRLPAKFPELYENSYFKIPRNLLRIIVVISIISCVGFVALVLAELPLVGYIYIGWTILTIVYYLLRVQWLKKSGFNWEEQISKIPGSDEE